MTTQGTFDRIVDAADRLRFGSLEQSIVGIPWMHTVGADGSLTIIVRGDQLPPRYLHTIKAYRFAQYVRHGWIDTAAAADDDHFSDTTDNPLDREFHILVIERETGTLAGYLSLVSAATFGLESDYPITIGRDLAVRCARDQVWEPKRLLRRAGMRRSQLAANAPWWALLGLTQLSWKLADRGQLQLLVGDGAPTGSPAMLSHLDYSVTTHHFTPRPGNRHGVFGPLWRQPEPAVVFEATPPRTDSPTIERLSHFLRQGTPGSVRTLLSQPLLHST